MLCLRLSQLHAFQMPSSQNMKSPLCVNSLAKEDTLDTLFTFGDEDDDDDEDDRSLRVDIEKKKKGLGAQRWANLNPSIKARIVKEGQERAIRNKKKREPKDVKKRREFIVCRANHPDFVWPFSTYHYHADHDVNFSSQQ